MLVSKDGKIVENVEELPKCARLEERAIKKLFNERW
jgi:hypothetical protein